MKLLQILALTSLNLLVAATTWAQQPETCPNREGWKPPPSRVATDFVCARQLDKDMDRGGG